MVDDRPVVLVVDDDEDVLALCRVHLEFEGYVVAETRDGEEALAMARRHRPDVVLLDVMLPGLDGWQLLSAIKADPDLCDTPVVLLTARTADVDLVRGWSAGAADHVAKPFTPLTLSQVVQDVLATTPEEEARRRRLLLDKRDLLRDV